jgi:hypothetical protein
MPYNRKQKILIRILLGVLLIFTTAYILLNFYVNKRVIAALKEQVKEGTHGEYTLSIDDLSISFLNRSVTLKDVIMAPSDQKAKDKAEYILKTSRLFIGDISLLPFFRDKDLIIGRMEFEEPQISIFQGSERLPAKTVDSTHVPFSLFKAISKSIHSVSIDHIDIINSKFNIYRGTADTLPLLAANENSISIKGFEINESSDKMNRLFIAQKFEIVMNKFSYHLPDGLYTIFGKKLYASYNDSLLKVDSLQLIPNFSKKEFGKVADSQISRVSLVAANVELKRFDVKRFLELNWLLAEKMEASKAYIDVYRDNNIPLKAIVRPSFQALLRDVPFLIAIDTIRFHDAFLAYQEIAEGATAPGTMKLSDIRGMVTGINNDSSSFTEKSKVVVVLDAEFMELAHFHADYSFPLNTRENIFYSSGSLSSMPIVTINPLLEKAKDIRVLSGQIDSMKFHFKANDAYSEGKMIFAYHDLEVDVKGKNEEKTFKTKLKNFVANDLILKKSNPGVDGKLREVNLRAERNPYRYFPYYSMQSMMSGIAASIEGEAKSKFLKRTRLLEKN